MILDTENNKALIQNAATLKQDEQLSISTASLFGLGASAVPDDAFAWLGKYNQHWWKRRSYVASIVVGSEFANRWFAMGNTSSATPTIEYSDSVVADPVTGEVLLADPVSSVKASYNNPAPFDVVKGKYIKTYTPVSSYVDGEIFYVSPTTEITTSRTNEYDINADMASVTGALTIGEWEFVVTNSNNSYPIGIVDGMETVYQGVPFDTAVIAPKITTGCYIGTGTSGEANPNTLTFAFVPKLVIVSPSYTGDSTEVLNDSYAGKNLMIYIEGKKTDRVGSSSTEGYDRFYSVTGTTLSWYVNGNKAHNQMNRLGGVYYYFAIG